MDNKNETQAESKTSVENDKNNDSTRKSKSVNLNKYNDPEGLTISKMKFGLFYLSHKSQFKLSIIFIILFIIIATYASFILSFASYIFIGMKQERSILSNALNDSNFHTAVSSIAPKNLITNETQLIKAHDKKYDFISKVANPNSRYWADISYSLAADGKIFGPFTEIIFPFEEKYFINNGLEPKTKISKIKIIFNKIDWHRLDWKEIPNWNDFVGGRKMFEVANKKFTPPALTNLSEKLNISTLSFDVSNNSPYSYKTIDLKIVLSFNGQIVGVAKTWLDRFLSSKTRTVDLSLYDNISRINKIEVYPELNYLDPDNYLQPFEK